MEHRTTVQVEQTTLKRMKKYKITKRESYDEIINRLLDEKDKNIIEK